MLTARMKHLEKKLREQKDDRALRRLIKEVDKSNKKKKAFAFREMKPQEKKWREQREDRLLHRLVKKVDKFRNRKEARASREADTFKAKQERRALRELDNISKENETCALQELQQLFENLKIQDTGRSKKKKHPHKPKPNRSYYWPQDPPSARDNSLLIFFPELPTAGVLAPQPNIPSFTVTGPESNSEPSAHACPETIDSSLLSPAYARQIPSTTQPKSSKSFRKPKAKTSRAQKVAPKPSLFSYDICDHPSCPIKSYTHEKGVFRYPDKYVNDEEYASANIIFGIGNPTPCVWDAYLRVMDNLKAMEAVSEEDVEMVRGFVEAHPKP